MTKYNFAVFICTHGRPTKQITLAYLKSCKCECPVYLVVDDEDTSKDEYIRMYGDSVLVFNKQHYIRECDLVLPTDTYAGVVFARNACQDFAIQFGYGYYVTCDDDISSIDYRFNVDNHLRSTKIYSFSDVIDAMCGFMQNTYTRLMSISQRHYYIGGINSKPIQDRMLRNKFGGFFLCSTEQYIHFDGIIQEDTISCNKWNNEGKLQFTVGNICFNTQQMGTSEKNTGMANVYGLLKDFALLAPKMVCPHLKVRMDIDKTGNNPYGMLYLVSSTRTTYPMILNESVRK